MKELEARLENTLATVDKVFQVELMKMPPPLRSARIGDLISEEEISASEVSIALKNECPEMHRPLKRVPSKRVFVVKPTAAPSEQPPPVQRVSSKASKGGNGKKKTRTLTGSAGSLRASSLALKRTQSLLDKNNEQTVRTKPRLRSVSAGDLHCAMPGSAAHITVTTAQGQAVCFSEETKDEINLDLLDDVAWCQIQQLKNLMEHLSRRSRSQR
uniref:borealin-2 n=1 Tax=Monopterus albus TaxID=43700 RepID=UPI0009B4091D|nr:borealin-2-like [Monopterus albus]